jgi:hypothetical protein
MSRAAAGAPDDCLVTPVAAGACGSGVMPCFCRPVCGTPRMRSWWCPDPCAPVARQGYVRVPLESGGPQLEWRQPCRADDITVGGQQRQRMSHTELSDQRIDRSELHPAASAPVAQIGSRDMIFPVRNQQRQGREPLDDEVTGFRPGESLQEFLQHEAVVTMVSPCANERARAVTSAPRSGWSRRSASDQTLVSTNRLTSGSALPCSRRSYPIRAFPSGPAAASGACGL